MYPIVSDILRHTGLIPSSNAGATKPTNSQSWASYIFSFFPNRETPEHYKETSYASLPSREMSSTPRSDLLQSVLTVNQTTAHADSVEKTAKVADSTRTHEENISLIYFYTLLCSFEPFPFNNEIRMTSFASLGLPDMLIGYDKNKSFHKQHNLFSRENLVASLLPNKNDKERIASIATHLEREFQASDTVKNSGGFDLRNRQIESLPEAIKYFSRLRSFNLDRNYLTNLPGSLEHVPLHSIGLSSNNLTSIPPVLLNHKTLELLDVSFNPISSLPQLANSPKLRHLHTDKSQVALIAHVRRVAPHIKVTINPQESHPEPKSKL
ncbi:MAG: hypothetical protein HKM07_02325 [Chlamydiae bacterium]|nr:hypothetical protein [Chlamydiota bacterium]